MIAMSSSQDAPLRTRIAPSPTGEFHVGGMAMALKNWAYTKKHGGQFIIRVEDTDQERLVAGATERMLAVIKDYGLSWDEGPDIGGPYAPYTQSERLATYKEYAEKLVASGHAYYCFATKEELAAMRAEATAQKQPPRYNGMYRDVPLDEARQRVQAGESHVIRLKVPRDKTITFNDAIRGEITFSSNEVSDQILLKSDGFPTYHLAVVVDDHLMDITYIMRGEEWISSTPKHILLYQAFGWELPQYAHIPIFLNPEGKGKMSKRKGTVSARSFLDRGYLPEALLNFFMILGWTHPTQKELLTMDEYVAAFEPTDVSKNSVAFDLKKLAWINGQYIRKLPQTQLEEKLKPFVPAAFPQDKLSRAVELITERLERLDQFDELTNYIYSPITHEKDVLLKRATTELVMEQLSELHTVLSAVATWDIAAIETVIRSLQESNDWKKKQFFMLCRVVGTGRSATPPLFEILELIGQEVVLERIALAKKSLE